MGKYSGDLVEIGLARETLRGTAAAPTYGMKWSTLSIVDKANMAVDGSRSGIVEDSRNSYPVAVLAEGEIEGPVRDRSIGLPIYSLFGTIASAAITGETLAYEHIFTVLESNQHPTLTVHKKEPNGGFDHALAMVDSLEVTCEPDAMITFKAGFKAKKRASATQTVTYATENVFLPKHTTFKLAATQATLEAATAINVRSAKLTMKQNVEEDRALGSVDPVDMVNRLTEVELTVDIVIADSTYITALLAGTAYAVRLDSTNTDVTIGAASNPRLRFELNKAVLQDAPPAYSRGDLTIQTLKFKAHYNETDSAMIKAYLRNLVATY